MGHRTSEANYQAPFINFFFGFISNFLVLHLGKKKPFQLAESARSSFLKSAYKRKLKIFSYWVFFQTSSFSRWTEVNHDGGHHHCN